MTTSNHNGGISRNRNLNLKKKEKNLAGTLENDFTMVLLVNTMLRRDTSGDHRVLKCVRILFSHPREVSDSLCVPKLSSSCVFFFLQIYLKGLLTEPNRSNILNMRNTTFTRKSKFLP